MKVLVDNFIQLGDLMPLTSNDPDMFWTVRVIKRKKENPDLEKNCKSLKLYHIKDRTELLEMKEKITKYAREHNARAYFNPNPKSWKKVSIQAMKELANIIEQEDYRRSWSLIDKVIDSGCNYGGWKVWIIDLDEFSENEINNVIDTVRKVVSSYDPRYTIKDPILAKVPTVNGHHLLTIPFDLNMFQKIYDGKLCEVKKNNPTLLYYESYN